MASSDGGVTKYYQAYGRAVAMREVPPAGGAGTLLYLLADHLGGTVEVLDAAGATVAETKYWPYGEPNTGTCTPARPPARMVRCPQHEVLSHS
ncbi:MAG: hypothetical protein KGK07_16250 [Chloroflexota bacterium]|nr:hypothetical protein [Chloroflexota bacterium]